jgi:hypothetical protein
VQKVLSVCSEVARPDLAAAGGTAVCRRSCLCSEVARPDLAVAGGTAVCIRFTGHVGPPG